MGRKIQKSELKTYNQLNIDEETIAEEKKTIPIILREPEKWLKISKTLNNRNYKYNKAKTTTDGIRIQPQTVKDYQIITKFFDDNKIQYHTLQLKQESVLKIIIKKIPTRIEVDEVVADLQEKGYEILKATRITDKDNKPTLAIYAEIEKKKIYIIKNCCELEITVESYNARNGYAQCHRCQKFGHAQAGCEAGYNAFNARNPIVHTCAKNTRHCL